ncbi:PREDICTED: uncharacterized protein LOC106784123 [Polistes canadensis]|uniref:uncharacterized protein LOC106784123 n=1 Tax=Polistes canadensis TaxID=91411 RepID=UPI000718D635|nr:PREDICTED: uncharacterized protein LOC106784123 [Polistes canadensis]
MQLMPNEEMAKNLHYRSVWLRHKNALKEINKLIANLEAQREDKEKTMESTMTQYKNDTMIIDRLNRLCLEDIKSIGWELKRDKLHDQLDHIKKELETIQTRNFKTISDINSRRIKTEAQLLSLINKFDVDMDDKLSEYEELCKTYESDKMEKNFLKAAIKLQEDTYNLFLKNVFDETSEYYTG